MIYNYNDALNFLNNTQVYGSRLGLANISELMRLLGDPQNVLKFIHVAGTNGKGSVCAFVGEILSRAGLNVGTYTSPHLSRVNERYVINGAEISDADFARVAARVKEKVDIMRESPTEFEIMTAIAFCYFHERACDIVILEVGLGGRLDATNIIPHPLVAVITALSQDHTEQLGSDIKLIAFEKASIIKPGCIAVSCEQEAGAMAVIEGVCKQCGVELQTARSSGISDVIFTTNADGMPIAQSFAYKRESDEQERISAPMEREFQNSIFSISLLGEHQIMNAAVALEVIAALRIKGYKIDESAVTSGLAAAKWQRRFELLGNILFDGAHNEAGAIAMYDGISRYFPGRKFRFVVGVLRDKEYEKMIRSVLPVARRFYTASPNSDRALSAIELADKIKTLGADAVACDTPKAAVARALSEANGDMICCFGSLYLLGEL